MLKHLLLAVLLGIVILLSYVAYHVGYFKNVKVESVGANSFILIGLPHLGPYHRVIEKIKLVEQEMMLLPAGCQYSFGLYLDDPRNTEQERLKSFGGCIVANPSDLPSLMAAIKEKGLTTIETRVWSYDQAVKATFEGSPGIGPFKVYPAVEAYRQGKQLVSETKGVLEVYEIFADQKMVTDYYFPMKLSAP